MASHGPIIFLGGAADALGWAQINTQMQLSMDSHGPIVFLEAAANVLGWAHFNAQFQQSIA